MCTHLIVPLDFVALMFYIGICWYHKVPDNKWTYDLVNHLLVDFDTIIALAFMTYITYLNACESHPKDENGSTISFG
jgi:hypothetical protein